MSLCKYKDIFGAPKEGIHSLRLFGVPVFDLFGTIALAMAMNHIPYLVEAIPNYLSRFLFNFSILYLLSIVIHKLFCVKTNLF